MDNNYEEETAPSTEILCRIAAIRNQYCTSEFFVLLLHSYAFLWTTVQSNHFVIVSTRNAHVVKILHYAETISLTLSLIYECRPNFALLNIKQTDSSPKSSKRLKLILPIQQKQLSREEEISFPFFLRLSKVLSRLVLSVGVRKPQLKRKTWWILWR